MDAKASAHKENIQSIAKKCCLTVLLARAAYNKKSFIGQITVFGSISTSQYMQKGSVFD